jgi:hypothetical protein
LSLLPSLSICLCVHLYVVQLVCLIAFLSTNKNYLTLLSLPWFTTNNLSIKNTFLKKNDVISIPNFFDQSKISPHASQIIISLIYQYPLSTKTP